MSRTTPVVLALAGALLLAGCAGGSTGAAKAKAAGDQLLTVPREDFATFTRNFNPFSPNAGPMTNQAIYEPLMIVNPNSGQAVPWLATSWKTAADGRSVTFTVRDGVKWSDGQPFTAADVVYTFKLQQKLLGGYTYVSDVTAPDPHTVVFSFDKPFSPGLFDVGQQVIIPQHVWSQQSDPAKWTNPNPVGTGPYTQVADFSAQSFDLKKNPDYWQPAKQHIAGIRMLAFSGNDAANLATVSGQTDWAGQYIPQVQKAFVDKDPTNHHYWYPQTGALIEWQLNTTKAPFNDPAVRKALSMAVDRDQVTKVGMSGYTTPADCTGLSHAYDSWRDQTLAASCTWTKHDVAAANAALDAAGYPKGPDGVRKLKNGKPFTFSISVGAESSDWLGVANIIAQNLKDVGVQATVKSPAWSAVVASYADGSFDSGIVWTNGNPTPYQFYAGMMSQTKVKPVGTQTDDDYHRFADPKADTLLDQYAAESDPAQQKATMNQLQALFNTDAPVVPLFSGPVWGAYNSSRFTGWPTAQNPYATLSDRSPTTVLVLTSLVPVKG